MENLGAVSSSSLEFLRKLGRRLGSLSGTLEKSERPAFFSRACLLQYNDFIRCFCTIASLMTFRTSSHFSCFYPFCFNRRYSRVLKNKIIIIIIIINGLLHIAAQCWIVGLHETLITLKQEHTIQSHSAPVTHLQHSLQLISRLRLTM